MEGLRQKSWLTIALGVNGLLARYRSFGFVKRIVVSQQIAGTAFPTPAELVSWLGAVQAQDFLGSLWSIGLRLPGTTQAAVEQAIANRSIIYSNVAITRHAPFRSPFRRSMDAKMADSSSHGRCEKASWAIEPG